MTKILVVEDEAEQAELIQLLLAQQYELTIAGSAEVAIESYQEVSPDLVIIDLRLADMSGFGLIQYLKDIDPQVKTMILSGVWNEANVALAMKLGCYAYIRKGEMVKRLVATIEELVSNDPTVAYSYESIQESDTFDITQLTPSQRIDRLVMLARQLDPQQEPKLLEKLTEQLTPERCTELLAIMLDRLTPGQKMSFLEKAVDTLQPSQRNQILAQLGTSSRDKLQPFQPIRLKLLPTPRQISKLDRLLVLYQQAIDWIDRQLPEGTPRYEDLRKNYYKRLTKEFSDLHSQHLNKIISLTIDLRKYREECHNKPHAVELGQIAMFDARTLSFFSDEEEVGLALPPKGNRRTHITFEKTVEVAYLPKELRKAATLRKEDGYWLEVPID